MKTATIVINRDSTFAPTQIVIKDPYGLKTALDMIRMKGFGNYSKSRFFWEIPVKNSDGEELVAYFQVKGSTRWAAVRAAALILESLSTTWMLGESKGIAMLGGYVTTILSSEWYTDPIDLGTSQVDPLELDALGDCYIRPIRMLPISCRDETMIDDRAVPQDSDAGSTRE
jgi:hypothetical protein